ncbi:1-deoxy-D-xylulose-5-phosphate synthase [Gilliamella sp. B3766]|nr:MULTISPECIES: 1-deoxy-D-xylulose-5-phosphate synthase [unclassified Gilliamella]MCX8633982.1 1-deoxy-D-xylulose-5-phosphate synthase [Gilliamella sp. B3758]MCX8600602.1 1-deoxy-D-xylulose-5-phosphate synthase [Gilliamella sp. B3722]MCX8609142.1 1-deoxy-D-xylulose-5-phosphate synthase [Gilliamella sp. B3771]MCX8609819.1 1-deoxy-D-xylulose-5-phosphate synthase [Gilliamella sp. B3891]MCX8612091.1 1-deoxy-D-xylulose-5-phosphate synthase [Gilliamella sp. B3773]
MAKMNLDNYPLLKHINSPEDLRRYPLSQLAAICHELRQYLLASVSQSSGHLASGLGVVELTTALHYVYHTPFDKIIWDVGHQAYPHKILTGRRDQMLTIRQKDGLRPFPHRDESEYDVLTTGHSSTSISAALGIAISEQKKQSGQKVAAIIGDGALTAGMAFEAMNHAGHIKPDMLVIVNDNDMSISENTGALNQHLTQILASRTYASFRESGKRVLENIPPLKELFKKTEEHLKGLVTPAILFEELGFNYIGPIDGHDIENLVSTLQKVKQLKGPQLLHVITQKGKGYAPAEKNPTLWHGVPKFNPIDGVLPATDKITPTYSQIFGDWLCEVAKTDKRLMAITPAMSEGSGMTEFARLYPEQFFDVAIAEQHAVTLAAGFAISDLKPVVAIYSTFLQRAYDQLIHDVAIQNLPVLFAIDRAGIVGADGETHQGAFDLSYLRCIPNMVIMTPSDENECRQMLNTGYLHNGPSAVRYPRGEGTGASLTPLTTIPIGESRLCRTGENIALLNFGTLLPEILQAAEQINATVIDMRFVKPLDEKVLLHISQSHNILVTVEENSIKGGAGSGVNEFLLSKKIKCDILNIGLPDEFIPQGSQNEIRSEMGLNCEHIIEKINEFKKR